MITRRITSRDGIGLVLREHGAPERPTIVAVHGYPDNQTIWDGVVAELADHFHLVTYDVRGAGESDKPRRTDAYRIDQLASDLVAVADAVSPDGPVHLLAHDWGSVQSWHALTDERFAGRFASYTSISGPCLDHIGQWVRSRVRRPTAKGLWELAVQAVFSGYIAFFQLPRLPEWAWRVGLLPSLIRLLERLDPATAAHPTRPRLADGLHGLELYRANGSRLSTPGERRTDIPVQVLAPTGDPFVSPALQTDVARWVSDLRVRPISGGHWLPRTRPSAVAEHVARLVDEVEPDWRRRTGIEPA